MNAWHTGPHGGRCPRTDGPQCSVYGMTAVRRYGAVLGVLAAARYVAACSTSDGYTYRRPVCPAEGSAGVFRVLILFARLALAMPAPASPRADNCGNPY